MTRKRYIKLLMSRGISRNDANACAREVVLEGGSYQQDYDDHWWPRDLAVEDFQKMIRDFYKALADALPGIQEAIAKTVKALNAGVVAFSDAVSESLKKT